MVVTSSALYIMAGIGILSLGAMLVGIDGATTDLLLAAMAVVTWSLFAFSSLDVVIRDSANATTSGPLFPLVYLGLALAFISVLGLLDRLANVMRSTTGATETAGMASERP